MVWASYVTEPDVRRGSEVYLIGAPLIINLKHLLPPPLPPSFRAQGRSPSGFPSARGNLALYLVAPW